MKKTFLLHQDSLDVIDMLTDEQSGKLLKKMRSYHNGNDYDADDKMVDIAFMSFKNQFDRDLETYKNVCDRNRTNGALGGRPRKTTDNVGNPENPSGLSDKPRKPKKADKDKDSDNDKDNKYNEQFEIFWKEYPLKKGKGKAYTAWKSAIKKTTNDVLTQKAKEYSLECSIKMLEKRFIKHAQGWLNENRYDDDYECDIDPGTSNHFNRYKANILGKDKFYDIDGTEVVYGERTYKYYLINECGIERREAGKMQDKMLGIEDLF